MINPLMPLLFADLMLMCVACCMLVCINFSPKWRTYEGEGQEKNMQTRYRDPHLYSSVSNTLLM